MEHSNGDRLKIALPLVGLGGLATGLVLHVAGRPDRAQIVRFAGVVPVLAALLVEILRSLWRGEGGLDIVAALSMSSALALGETLAAAVVAVMYSGGTFLDSFAEGRPAGRCAISSHGSHAWRRDIATTAWSTCRSTTSCPATAC